jgi:hypothetical protein
MEVSLLRLSIEYQRCLRKRAGNTHRFMLKLPDHYQILVAQSSLFKSAMAASIFSPYSWCSSR